MGVELGRGGKGGRIVYEARRNQERKRRDSYSNKGSVYKVSVRDDHETKIIL